VTPTPPPPPVPIIDPSTITNRTVIDPEIVGQWNKTIGNKTEIPVKPNPVKKDLILFTEKSKTMYYIALSVLLIFILMHLFFKCRYKSEYKDKP
jgi:hypothetical protein